MFDLLSTPTEMHPPSAQEVAIRARRIEKQQALMTAELYADASPRKTRKMGLIDMLIQLVTKSQ